MIQVGGRWAGALASRPLPDEDDSIGLLDEGDRALVTSSWLGRAAAERRAGDAFVVIREALTASNASAELCALAERAVDDEARHAEICRVVATRYAGREVDYQHLVLAVPKFSSAPAELRPSLQIVAQCVLNETTASAFLESCLDDAQGALVRAALRELLSDEIDHARIGWAHLSVSTPEHLRAISGLLLPLLQANVREWRKPSAPLLTDADALRLLPHGVPVQARTEAAVTGAVRDLIVPGLDRVGIDTAELQEWMAQGCPA